MGRGGESPTRVPQRTHLLILETPRDTGAPQRSLRVVHVDDGVHECIHARSLERATAVQHLVRSSHQLAEQHVCTIDTTCANISTTTGTRIVLAVQRNASRAVRPGGIQIRACGACAGEKVTVGVSARGWLRVHWRARGWTSPQTCDRHHRFRASIALAERSVEVADQEGHRRLEEVCDDAGVGGGQACNNNITKRPA
jgi:hypothetical protein